jgi:hypothetical protein
MAADAWKHYNKFKEYMADGSMDLDGDAFKVALYLDTSNAATLTNSLKGDLTNEHAQQFGYLTGGDAVTRTWVESSGTVTFDSDDPTWTAAGGSIICRFAVLWDDTPASPLDPLVSYSLLDNTPANVTVNDGNTLTIQIHANGYFQLSG